MHKTSVVQIPAVTWSRTTLTTDGNKHAHRIPHQASYKYMQRGLPEKEVLPRLQGPRGI